MEKSNLQHKIQNLASLGCAFAIDRSTLHSDPEITIINSLDFFWKNQDLFSMLLGVLYYKIYDLIHVERLLSLAKKINDKEKLLLIVLCHLIAPKDKRYKLVINKLSTQNILLNIPDEYNDPYLLKKWGLEPTFLKYNIKIPNCILPPERKFYTKKHIIKNNKWLKMRALIGPTYRADIIYLKSAKIISTPSEALKILGCSKAVVYDLWAKLSNIDGLEKLVI